MENENLNKEKNEDVKTEIDTNQKQKKVKVKKNNKKVLIILVIIFILLSIITISIIAVIKLANKELEPISGDKFNILMEEKGFETIDAMEEFGESNLAKAVYIAIDPDVKYRLEYYEFNDLEYTIDMFNQNKVIIESSKGRSSSESTVNGKNFNKYSLSTNNIYKSIVRVENTFVFIETDAEFKEDIKTLLKELGY